MELLVCMSIAGSIPVVICLLLYVIQRENYNYILGRRLLITGIFFYLIPIQLIKYLIPEEVYPEALFNEEAQLYLSNSLSFWTERKGEYIWMPQWFDIVSKLWLGGIVIFAVYEIIKYWRGVHYIKNFIFEKEEDSENNLTYYLIPDETYGPCTIGFFRQSHMLHTVLKIPVKRINQTFISRQRLKRDRIDKVRGILCHQHMNICMTFLQCTCKICDLICGNAACHS